MRKIKADIDIVAVTRALGLEPQEQGNDTYCRCPVNRHEHDERSPRCGLDREKGVWNCLKCDASGDAVGLVKAARGCDARDAYEWLEQQGLKKKACSDADELIQRLREITDAYDPVEQLAEERGWSPDAMRALGAEAAGMMVRFPMRTADGQVTGHKRRRGNNEPFEVNDNEVKSLTGGGDKNGAISPDDKAQMTATCATESQRFRQSDPQPAAIATCWRGQMCVHVGVCVELNGRLGVLETGRKCGPRWLSLRDFERRYLKVIYYS